MDEAGRTRFEPSSAPFFIFVVTFLGLLVATFPYSCFSVDCLPPDAFDGPVPGICRYSQACSNLLGMDFGRIGLARGGLPVLSLVVAIAVTVAVGRIRER
ncbi:MAG: hypothetical protein WD096_09955 [Actinomycetota bacterium]